MDATDGIEGAGQPGDVSSGFVEHGPEGVHVDVPETAPFSHELTSSYG